MNLSKIAAAFENAEYKVRKYSGRGMYGIECLCVHCTEPLKVIPAVIIGMLENDSNFQDLRFVVESLSNPRFDSMGRGCFVIYWPDLEWSEGMKESEDFEDEDDFDEGGEG